MPFLHPIKVYYPDTDALGMVYHANYFKFFDIARTELFFQHQVLSAALEAEHKAFVVAHSTMDYKKAATFGQEYQVSTQIMQVKGASVVLKQRLIKADAIYCIGVIKLAFVNIKTLKPYPLPKTVRTQLNMMESHSAK